MEKLILIIDKDLNLNENRIKEVFLKIRNIN